MRGRKVSDVKLVKDSNETIQKINQKLDELEGIINPEHRKNPSSNEFDNWRHSVSRMLKGIFTEQSISKEFLTDTKVLLNKFSAIESDKNLERSFRKAERYLQELREDIESGRYLLFENKIDSIDKMTALIIIRRILRNFHKHIESMYQYEVHGSGKIKKEDLDRIRIGNEYDVQRVLYSLIRPVFPAARLEAADDAGYNSVRYDIILNKYDIVIEVKCTRESMTERNLTEELGADSFHYKAEHLFLFIFDRVGLIKNLDAFEKSFYRQKQEAGKEIEAVVIQEVKL